MSLPTFLSPVVVRRFSVNPNGRDLIVGDLHGCVSKFRARLDEVGFDPARDRVFVLGDLIDRGPESPEAVALLSEPWFHAVMGNHEDMAIAYHLGLIDAPCYASNGGAWFIGLTPAERQPIVDALSALPVAIELETPLGLLGLVHADCPYASWPLFVGILSSADPDASAARNLALWSRTRAERLFDGPVDGVRAVVVGHTVVERPASLGNVLFIDTGAWLEGGAVDRRFAVLDASTLSPAYRPLPSAA